MGEYKGGFKQYIRATPGQVLAFLKLESDIVSAKVLGDFDSLSRFDLRQDISFLIQHQSRPVGFACMRVGDVQGDRRLTKIYITPDARRSGCASFVLRGMKITKITVPVRHIELIRLCRKNGFQYNDNQPYPQQVTELWRPISGIKTHVERDQLQITQLG